MSKPQVTKRCPANAATGPDERIIEFSGEGGGGLIAFRNTEGGGTTVDVYHCDPTVKVRVPALVGLRSVLEGVRTYNAKLDDPRGDGTGDDAQAPDGQSYNDLLEIIGPLFSLVGLTAP